MIFDVWTVGLLLTFGLLAGLLGGMLGIGGSVLMIPALTIAFGPSQHFYQGAAMIVNFCVAVPSAIRHARAGAVLTPVVRVTIPVAAVTVIAGVWLSSGAWFRGANEVYLSRLFGAFLLYEAGYNVYRLFSQRRLPDLDEAAAARIPVWKTGAVVGVPTGLVAGLLGIGGGALAVPLQQAFLRMPLRRAIANSAATIVLLSVIGATYKNYTNLRDGIALWSALKLAALMAPTAVIGGLIGSGLTHSMPRKLLRVAVVVLMCYGGIALLRRG
ncbi:MAG: UPF0721 transmembrane protein [Phycisphaerae bacterium]